MNRYLSLLLSLGILAALGYGAYLSCHRGSGPQAKALALAEEFRGTFQTDKSNSALIDQTWLKMDALLKQQGPSANIQVTTMLVEAFKYYRKTNDAWDPRYQRVNATVRDFTRRIADACVDVADAAMAGNDAKVRAKRDEISNLHIAMKDAVDRIDPRFLAERWKP